MRKRSEVDVERARARRRLREEVGEERAPRFQPKRRAAVVEERERERERSSEREAADDEDGEFTCVLGWFLGYCPAYTLSRRVTCATSTETAEEEERYICKEPSA